MSETTLVVAIICSVAACIAYLVYAVGRPDGAHRKRETGSRAQYEALQNSLSTTIVDTKHYGQAVARMKSMLLGDLELREFAPGKRLTFFELRYVSELFQSVRQFEWSRPWVTLEKRELVELRARIDRVVELCHQCGQLRERLTALICQDWHSLVLEASDAARFARSFIDGLLPPAEAPELARKYERDGLTLMDRLDAAVQKAQRAVLLLGAELDGRICHSTSVTNLLEQAANAESLDMKLFKLSKAVYQADNPDATAEPHDLPRALQALALVVWRHLHNHRWAEELFMRVLACTTDKVLLEQTFGALALLCTEQGRLADAVVYFDCQKQVRDKLRNRQCRPANSQISGAASR